MFFEHQEHTSTTGVLHLLFPLAEMLFSSSPQDLLSHFQSVSLSISMWKVPMTNPFENTASSPHMPASLHTAYSTFMFHFPPKYLSITNLILCSYYV